MFTAESTCQSPRQPLAWYLVQLPALSAGTAAEEAYSGVHLQGSSVPRPCPGAGGLACCTPRSSAPFGAADSLEACTEVAGMLQAPQPLEQSQCYWLLPPDTRSAYASQ